MVRYDEARIQSVGLRVAEDQLDTLMKAMVVRIILQECDGLNRDPPGSIVYCCKVGNELGQLYSLMRIGEELCNLHRGCCMKYDFVRQLRTSVLQELHHITSPRLDGHDVPIDYPGLKMGMSRVGSLLGESQEWKMEDFAASLAKKIEVFDGGEPNFPYEEFRDNGRLAESVAELPPASPDGGVYVCGLEWKGSRRIAYDFIVWAAGNGYVVGSDTEIATRLQKHFNPSCSVKAICKELREIRIKPPHGKCYSKDRGSRMLEEDAGSK